MRWIGRAFIAIATLLFGPLALAIALASSRSRAGLRERLWPPQRRSDDPIWIHVASVGEAAAAEPLVDAVRERGLPLLLTAQTLTGRERLAARYEGVVVRLVPIDHPWWTACAMRRVRPCALVLVETEVWPSLVAAADRRGVPVVVVSGRLSERAMRAQRELGSFFGRTFARLTAVGARSEKDAERFIALGVPRSNVRVTGDLKWAKPPDRAPIAPEIMGFMARRPTIVLGSTHADEVTELLAAIDAVRAAGRDVQWLFAPRHPEEAEALMRRLAAAGLLGVRRSSLTAGVGAAKSVRAEVLVLDTLGELRSVWPHALIAVVGGTFGATAGHDLLEPVHAGRPLLFGPSTEGVASTAAALVAAGAAIRVRDGASLGREIARLLDATQERADRVVRGTRLLEAGRAALDANVKLVIDAAAGALPGAPSPGTLALRATATPQGLYHRDGPGVGAVTAAWLALASHVYAASARIDRATARFGLRREMRLPCAVVSVGGWLAGGSAKTPVTIWLARALEARGHRVVVVTRGHGVRLGRRVEIASHGAGPCAPATQVGDEALVIARRAEGVPVLVARDRRRAGLCAVAEFGCDVLLLDDGFQHFGLARDVDLVCLDAEIGLGNGRVLPAGPLRESPRAWSRADSLVVTGGALAAHDERAIERHAPGLRRFTGDRIARGWRDLRTGERLPPGGLTGRTAGLLAGLADPASFRALAERCGVEIGGVRVHPDHHAYDRHEIETLGERSRLWVTTEKDSVKIDVDWIAEGVDLFVLEIDWEPRALPSLVRYVEHRCGLARADEAADSKLEKGSSQRGVSEAASASLHGVAGSQ